MYVAITRARRRLYLSFAQTRMLHGQTRYNIRSRFFDELPPGLLKWLTPRFVARQPIAQTTYAQPPYLRSNIRVKSEPPKDSGFRVGQNVLHPKFGAGIIVGAEGGGTDARVQVNFGAAGVKWLALQFAKLTPA